MLAMDLLQHALHHLEPVILVHLLLMEQLEIRLLLLFLVLGFTEFRAYLCNERND